MIFRPLPACILVACAALVFAATASAVHQFPPPLEHDEYSYLLGAETFLHGRLTNPPHPMWQHFETFHVLQQPTYASKYPPASALFIAAGWAATNHPIAGVWLSFVFMCVALCWMLQGWLGPKLGLGVAFGYTSWSAVSYWSYSFWGGAVAAGAGALLLGALHRIVRGRGTTSTALALGLGLIILGNSRPYEGLLVAIPVLAVLGRWLWRHRDRARAVLLPLSVVGAVGSFGMGAYNHAVTGSWRTLPYTTYQKARGGASLFVWQAPQSVAPPADPTMRAYMAWEDSTYRAARTPRGRVEYLRSFVADFGGIVLPGLLLLPLLLIPLAIREWWTRFAVGTIALGVAGMGLTTYFLPHYAAPLVGLMLFVYGACLRWITRLQAGSRPIGRMFAAAIIGLWFLVGVPHLAWQFFVPPRHVTGADLNEWPRQRQLIADSLSGTDRRGAVVIVRYGPAHGSGNEWVYNAADIDASPVVWARDLGDAPNQELAAYFPGRRIWIVDVNEDTGPYTVRPYPPHAP